MPLIIAANTIGNNSVEPEFFASCSTFNKLVPSLVAIDQLLCLPLPLTP